MSPNFQFFKKWLQHHTLLPFFVQFFEIQSWNFVLLIPKHLQMANFHKIPKASSKTLFRARARTLRRFITTFLKTVELATRKPNLSFPREIFPLAKTASQSRIFSSFECSFPSMLCRISKSRFETALPNQNSFQSKTEDFIANTSRRIFVEESNSQVTLLNQEVSFTRCLTI